MDGTTVEDTLDNLIILNQLIDHLLFIKHLASIDLLFLLTTTYDK